jgi:hypothetical protein
LRAQRGPSDSKSEKGREFEERRFERGFYKMNKVEGILFGLKMISRDLLSGEKIVCTTRTRQMKGMRPHLRRLVLQVQLRVEFHKEPVFGEHLEAGCKEGVLEDVVKEPLRETVKEVCVSLMVPPGVSNGVLCEIRLGRVIVEDPFKEFKDFQVMSGV